MSQEIIITDESSTLASAPQVALSQQDWMDVIGTAKLLKTAEVGLVATSEYYEAKVEGEKKRGVFIKFGETMHKSRAIPGEYDYQKSIEFVDENNKLFVCSAKALVREFERLNIIKNTPFEITYKGKEKGENGDVKIFEVALLAVKRPELKK